ncbi:MAG: hypothetical protein HYZ22_20835 [Chloroflexi bacterium]|nr:hypothetical protein [Chloroflexota bacterium]
MDKLIRSVKLYFPTALIRQYLSSSFWVKNIQFLEEPGAPLSNSQSGQIHLIGHFEGFFKQLSGSNQKIITVQAGENCEYWKLE